MNFKELIVVLVFILSTSDGHETIDEESNYECMNQIVCVIDKNEMRLWANNTGEKVKKYGYEVVYEAFGLDEPFDEDKFWEKHIPEWCKSPEEEKKEKYYSVCAQGNDFSQRVCQEDQFGEVCEKCQIAGITMIEIFEKHISDGSCHVHGKSVKKATGQLPKAPVYG